MGKNDAVIQALRTALTVTPESAPLHKHLADLLMEDGAGAEAIAEYRRALSLAPEDDGLKLTLAEAYYRQSRADVALVILEELLHKPSPAAQVYLLAARAYLATGDGQTAADAYHHALRLDASLADADLAARLPAATPVTVKPESAVSGTVLDVASGGVPAADDVRVFVTAEESGGLPAVDIERPTVSFQNVGGMDKLKEEIRLKIIYPLVHPDIYKAYGKKMGGGILMYGPPGCGKTYLARATAGEVRAAFMAVGLHDVLDMYIGQSEQNLHAIFEAARRHAPCVLFFDEVDALGAKRSDMRYSSMRQVINQFLSEMDGVTTSNEGVLILAATNAPWHLDSALRRPGRFDRVIFVPPPDVPARAAILQLMLADKPTQSIDYGRLARETEGFSGADLCGIVDVAVEGKLRQAMQTGIPKPLTTDDLRAALKAARATTQEWFETARNYAIYANEGGTYDEVLDYLKVARKGKL